MMSTLCDVVGDCDGGRRTPVPFILYFDFRSNLLFVLEEDGVAIKVGGLFMVFPHR